MSVPALRRSTGLSRTDKVKLDLFRRTVGKDLTPTEFDEAVEYCEVYNANPLTKDIYFFIFDADKPDKRRVVPVLSIAQYRKTAARSGNYRPDEHPAVFTYDETLKGPANPKGIVDCTVTVYQFSHGEWHPIRERLRWDERVPLKMDAEGYDWIDTGETWADTGKPKKKKVPRGEVTLVVAKETWVSMGETMISKCTEAAAIRKGWPTETDGSYVDGELDRREILDLTATEVVEKFQTEEREKRIGAANTFTISWCDNGPLAQVPEGKIVDDILKWARDKNRDSSEIKVFRDVNKHALRHFWAVKKSDALELGKALDARIAELAAEEAKETA